MVSVIQCLPRGPPRQSHPPFFHAYSVTLIIRLDHSVDPYSHAALFTLSLSLSLRLIQFRFRESKIEMSVSRRKRIHLLASQLPQEKNVCFSLSLYLAPRIKKEVCLLQQEKSSEETFSLYLTSFLKLPPLFPL